MSRLGSTDRRLLAEVRARALRAEVPPDGPRQVLRRRLRARLAVLVCLAGLFAAGGPTRATDDRAGAEQAVAEALDRAVRLVRAGEDDALAGRLACWTGTPGPGTLLVRPCLPAHDAPRVRAMAAALREAFGADVPYVLDWLTLDDEGGVPVRRTQVKVRSTEPPTLTELRFVDAGGELLLADAGAVRLEPPAPPPPPSGPRETVERRTELLFRLAVAGEDGAAELIACPSERDRALRPCDPTRAPDRARVHGLLQRLQAFQTQVGPTGWGFTGYRTAIKREGTWHLLEIGYLDPRAGGAAATAYAAYFEVDGALRLGELLEWPE